MSERGQRLDGDAGLGVLHGRAVRTPLPNEEAERLFYENMMAVADGRERKADLLADPDVPLLEAYELEFDRLVETFRRRLRHVAGDDYRDAAAAYARGERDDRVAELGAYYTEGLWRLQERNTLSEMVFSPVILRYRNSFTVNVRFATGPLTADAVRFESPQHCTEDLEDSHAETYHAESSYSQRRAAAYIRETAQTIREAFPDPAESTLEERAFSGIVSASERRGTVFADVLERAEPDPGRFDAPATAPTLVPEGSAAKRTERELFPDADVVA